jgi:hypothetical protein
VYCTNPINSPDRVTRDRKGEFTNPPNVDVMRDRGEFRRIRAAGWGFGVSFYSIVYSNTCSYNT